ncbi:MAG: tRNA uridine-5-carboxymethylaminomethyl(34) synthesis GTPase MnmE [Candidatus Omnitrophica bacterium]|nr:tRNA uridine-5-carboxymethylaminomethyl(34) synthesis GTPase MnmE [Candidatus Omnitrophota bacterium]
MLIDNFNDTIAAISTAVGEGAVGIVRLSGPQALAIADAVFSGKKGLRPSQFKTYTMHYGRIVYAGQVLDEVILTVMRAPYSYTREDVVEINCHGGIVALHRVLDSVLENGCRMAEPGEFTRRAFLNGRIDLSQAEAVIDIIRAKTDSALKISLEQLKGGLSKEIDKIRQILLNILVILEASIDFPEEDLKQQDNSEVSKSLDLARLQLSRLLDGAKAGRILRDGIQVVICGRPNVGKSSLLNALLKKERAIVTPLAGTTRDSIEEMIDIKGIPVRIVDTAGILKPRNLVERKAVRRARGHIRSADLTIILFDASKKLEADDWKLIEETRDTNVIAVINKIDLKSRINKEELLKVFHKVVELSAKKARNINLLEDALCEFVYHDRLVSPEFMLVSNLRHISALKEAQKLLDNAASALCDKLPLEFFTQDLKDASVYLDKILGKDFSGDLLDRIFADFCIGK